MEDAAIDVHDTDDGGTVSSEGIPSLGRSLARAATSERPRERLWRDGTRAIGDGELVAIILGTGVRDHPSIAIAQELLRSTGGIAGLSRSSPRELAQVTGIGAARAARGAAAFQLGRRAIEVIHYRDTLGEAVDVYRCVAPRLAGLAQEVFLAIGVDIRNGLLDIVEV